MTKLAINDQAQQIEQHHAAAHAAADKAIEHAKEAGRLLLEVKAALPHGEFSKWVAERLTVSQRQAQRYMAAAQGKPLPLRKVAEALPAPVKNDTVSLFKIRPNEAVRLEMDRGGWVDTLDIFPSTHEGFFHYLFTSGERDAGCSATYSKKAVRQDFIPKIVQEEMPDWEFANITRTKQEGREYNVVGTTAAGVDWIGNPPWVAADSSTHMKH